MSTPDKFADAEIPEMRTWLFANMPREARIQVSEAPASLNRYVIQVAHWKDAERPDYLTKEGGDVSELWREVCRHIQAHIDAKQEGTG